MKIVRYLRYILFPFALLYGLVLAVRNWFYNSGVFKSYSFDVPVIGVGNISVGGTGKTPHTEWLVQLLQSEFKVAVLSRGYGRSSKGFIEVHPDTLVKVSGDEPLQIKNKFPEVTVAVDEDRAHGIKMLLQQEQKPDVILLDDAFQHRRVKPGKQILLVDFNRPIHRDFVLPAGNLREFARGRKRADIIVFTKCPDLFQHEIETLGEKYILRNDQFLFFTTFAYQKPLAVYAGVQPLSFSQLKEASVLLVTGIANPDPLVRFMEDKCTQLETLTYADHYNFTQNDINKILLKYSQLQGKTRYIITTEKDAMRLKEFATLQSNLRNYLFYIPVGIKVLNEETGTFKHLIKTYVREN